MNSPLVSVIIPCYNASKYVEQAVRSVMEQTYQNLEIICCDDCSTDNTLEILEKLALEDSRITVVKNDSNLKIVKTLNKLIGLATGKYIARMDADDISLPERIEKQVEFLECNSEYAMCGTNAFHINEEGIEVGSSRLPLSYEDNKFFLAYYSTFYHPTIMLKADIYKQNLYLEDFLYAEDYELWCRLFFDKNVKAANLEQSLFKYRVFQSQTSNVHHQEQVAASSKILDSYDIVEKKDVEFHKNIYFQHVVENIGKEELDYIKKQYRVLCKKNYYYSYESLHKILYHVFKCYPKKCFIPFLFKSKGMQTFLKIMRGK